MRGQKPGFRHLLGNGAAALGIAPLDKVGNHRAGEGIGSKPKLGIKTPVFGGNNGVFDIRGQFEG